MADLKGAEYISSKTEDTISVVGDLSIRQYEGGFTPDGIYVGNHDLSTIIGNLFSLELDDRDSLGNQDLGLVRLTVERLKD